MTVGAFTKIGWQRESPKRYAQKYWGY